MVIKVLYITDVEMILTQRSRLRLGSEDHQLVTAMSCPSACLYNVGLSSDLDNEPVQKRERHLNQCMKRGSLWCSKIRISTDANGAANILRKFLASANRLADWYCERAVKEFVHNPVRVKFSNVLSSPSKAPAIASA